MNENKNLSLLTTEGDVAKDTFSGINTSRRDFIKLTCSATGGLALTFSIAGCSNFRVNEYRYDGSWSVNAWIEITPTNEIIFTLDRVEMGQGTYTGLTTLLAEELHVDPKLIKVVFAGVENVYRNPDYGLQLTGGSNSLSSSWEQIRYAGATARQMLITAAQQVFGVTRDQIICDNRTVTNQLDGKSMKYGDLARLASKLRAPKEVQLTPQEKFKYIGKQNARLDSLEKVTGKAVYGIDVAIPNMHYSVVVRPEFIGSELSNLNRQEVLKSKGVVDVIEISRGIAIVANSYWNARKAADLVKAEWELVDGAPVSSQLISDFYKERAEEDEGNFIREEGGADDVFKTSNQQFSQEYSAPFLAHATMEPMNCVARILDDKAEIWTGTQAPDIARVAVAKVTDISLDDVTIYNQFIGGGFGRRLSQDFVAEAAEIAFKTGKAIKLVWSREDDTKNDLYRPASYHRISASLDSDNRIASWNHHLVAPGIMDWYVWDASPAMFPWAPKFMYSTLGHVGLLTAGTPVTPADHSPYEGADTIPYDIPNLVVRHTKADSGVPVSYWRSVGHSQNAFVVESAISELAAVAGVDEYLFRKKHLQKSPRHLAVLDLAAKKGNWGKPSSPDSYQGLAVHKSFGSFVAQVAEIKIHHNQVSLVKVTCVIDCGQVVNPDIVRMQMESGIIFGATAALYGEITIKEGRIQQSNFHDYPIMRMNESPDMDIVIVQSKEKPTGVGEPSVPPIAPAIASAVYKATGKRVHDLPIKIA